MTFELSYLSDDYSTGLKSVNHLILTYAPPTPRFSCNTTAGQFVVELRHDLAPNSAARIQEMVEIGFFNQGIAFFRVNNWITQFGADQTGRQPEPFPSIRSERGKDSHPDMSLPEYKKGDKLTPWVRGTIASIGGTQLLVVITPNSAMGAAGHDAPAGFVVSGMEVFDRLYKYNDIIDNPKGDPGPTQGEIFKSGLTYIHDKFPKTDIIHSCAMV